MSGPLEGIRVLEVAMDGFVPSAGAVLAEWGADVIKVEHAVTGDPQRGLRQTGPLRVVGDPNPNIEHANRGKRSIGLDVSTPEGREVLLELAAGSDVFLTSFLPAHRRKFGMEHLRFRWQCMWQYKYNLHMGARDCQYAWTDRRFRYRMPGIFR